MHLAFYAPLKSPNHPVPSGDRTIARGLLSALRYGGHTVDLTSELRIYDKFGDPKVQEDLQANARAEADRILARADAQAWQAWITYHNYYKAPDLIGPKVCESLGIPYLLIEATRAKKRLTGPWAGFAKAAEAACDRAKVVFFFTEQDAEALRRDAPPTQDVRPLLPFLNADVLPNPSDLQGPILIVGMMRAGDKLASYALAIEALALLDGDWTCDVVGDGPARKDVEALFSRFGQKVRFLGAQPPATMPQLYASACMLFWPGVNEAFGMVYLEAQAAGLPIVAQDRPGVCDVVHGPKAPITGGAKALADRLHALRQSPELRRIEGARNRTWIAQHSLLPAAARTLSDGLEAL